MSQPAQDIAKRWRGEFRELERRCPWPGPRPLEFEDPPAMLVGRDDDISLFRREVDSHRLILLTGDSGVGKSSLLERGLIPELIKANYTTVICRDWSGTDENTNPAEYLGARIRDDFARQGIEDLNEGAEVFWQLEEKLGSRAVIVLDQFEELIRYSPQLTEEIFRLILDINHETNLKLVISFRNEYLHRLRPIENQAKPFTMSMFFLDEIHDDFVDDVMTAANSDEMMFIDDEAVGEIADTWRSARKERVARVDAQSTGRIGLLHLQALLYSLYNAKDGEPITLNDFKSFKRDAPSSTDVFRRALAEAITTKIGRCRDIAEQCGLDFYLVNGTIDVIARSVKHLSSAGYKLVREAKDLMKVTLNPEVDILLSSLHASRENDSQPEDGPIDQKQFDMLFATLIEPVTRGQNDLSDEIVFSDRRRIADLTDSRLTVGAQTPWAHRLHEANPVTGSRPLPHFADPSETSSGALLGAAPANGLIEEMRKFAFALMWLVESSLVRISTPGGQTMVSLIHDGFGDALLQWSVVNADQPAAALSRLTTSRADGFIWRNNDSNSAPELRGTTGPVVWPNVRWRGNLITAEFEQLIFVNSDFRGSFFEDCVFEGVTFVNCLLDGAVFSDCTFKGAMKPASGIRTSANPQFLVDCAANPRLPNIIARYMGLPFSENAQLRSQAAGMPAIPGGPTDANYAPWTFESGGVSIYGGKISSFMVRNCQFVDGGTVAFRRVAGSGCDLVDQNESRFEFFSSAIRHVSVTSPEDVEGARTEIVANGSMLVDVWLSEHLVGSMSIDDCTAIHFWNSSPGMKVTAHNSRVLGLVNAEPDDTCVFVTGSDDTLHILGTPLAAEIESITRLMDYRRNPYLGDIE